MATMRETLGSRAVAAFSASAPMTRNRVADETVFGATRRQAWILPFLSASATVGLALYLAVHKVQVDLDVYLMGGRHALRPDLYTVQFGWPFLRFTYPPFAALVFSPMARLFGDSSGQVIWALVNVGSLFALVFVSLRAARPDFDRRALLRWSLTALFPALLLNPVFLTVGLGQINLLLCAVVLWDLVGSRRVGRWTLPLGLLTGIASAVKLTPLIFLAYLAVSGRRRGAAVGVVTFLMCSGITAVIAPATSWQYWTHYMFDAKRAGALLDVSDQNLASALARFDHATIPNTVLWPLAAAILIVGLAVAVAARRRGSPFLGVLVCAVTGLVISPITWTHHMVWLLPLIAWLALGEDRPRHGQWWAATAAVLFWIAPIWWVPTSWRPSVHPPELAEHGWQLIAGNSFFLASMAFLVAIVIQVWRLGAARSTDQQRRPGGSFADRPSSTSTDYRS